MSYQRPSEGRFYVWMGSDGLHIMHNAELLADVVIKHDAAGVDNAKAIMCGLCDVLSSEGISVKMRRGQPEFRKSA